LTTLRGCSAVTVFRRKQRSPVQVITRTGKLRRLGLLPYFLLRLPGSFRPRTNGDDAMASTVSLMPSAFDLSRGLIRMLRELHRTAPVPQDRQRALLLGLCQLFDGHRASIRLSRIESSTGLSRVMNTVTVQGPFSQGTNGSVISAPRSSVLARKRASPREVQPDDGPCHDSYVPLDGVRLVACLSVARAAGHRRFTPTERQLIDLVHNECAWVYDGLR
jgi:hypothetical protein